MTSFKAKLREASVPSIQVMNTLTSSLNFHFQKGK